MSETVIISMLTTIGAVAGAVAAVYTVKRTSRQADKASQRDNAVEQDRIGLEGLRELAEQNRLDRDEWRRDRNEMRERMDKLENEVSALRRKVGEYEAERARDKQKIERLRHEVGEFETLVHALTRYIRRLREFIAGTGHVPPEPEVRLPLD